MNNKNDLLIKIKYHSEQFSYHHNEFIRLWNELESKLSAEEKAHLEMAFRDLNLQTSKH